MIKLLFHFPYVILDTRRLVDIVHLRTQATEFSASFDNFIFLIVVYSTVCSWRVQNMYLNIHILLPYVWYVLQ
jgi:hypothetical protein